MLSYLGQLGSFSPSAESAAAARHHLSLLALALLASQAQGSKDEVLTYEGAAAAHLTHDALLGRVRNVQAPDVLDARQTLALELSFCVPSAQE